MCSACLETRRWSYHPRRNQGCWRCMHQTSRSNRTWDLANGSNHENNSFVHLKGTSYLTYHSFTRLLILLNVLEKDGKSWWSTSHLHSNNSQQKRRSFYPQKRTLATKNNKRKMPWNQAMSMWQNQPDAARNTRSSRSTTCDSNDSIVLGEGGIRRGCHQNRKDAVQAIGQQASSHPVLMNLTGNKKLEPTKNGVLKMSSTR